MKLVLASASPRRKDLLEQAGFEIACVVSGVPELEDSDWSPEALALENAERKAAAVAANFPDEIVIAADTVVWFDGAFFGKPADPADAVRMLETLVGKTHQVVTGVVIHFPKDGGMARFAESSHVTFHPLTASEIHAYLSEIHPYDKAGAYAAQDDNGRLIARIDGLVSNVIGLPVERVREVLEGA